MDSRFFLALAMGVLALTLTSSAVQPSESLKNTAFSPTATTGGPKPSPESTTATAEVKPSTTINGTVTTTMEGITEGSTPSNASVPQNATLATPTAATADGSTSTRATEPTPTWTTGTNTTSISNATSGTVPVTHPTSGTISPAPGTTVSLNTTSSPLSSQSTEYPHQTDNTTSWVSTTEPALNSTHDVKLGLEDSELMLTVVFSVVLGVFVLGLVMYKFKRCHQQRVQYSHQPLTEDYAEAFVTDDDTLVISGGLYDGHVCEPITTQDDPISCQPTQFRLEFLNDEQ